MLLPSQRLLLAAVANRSTLTHWGKGKKRGRAGGPPRWWVVPPHMRARSSPAVQPDLRTVTPRAASMRAQARSVDLPRRQHCTGRLEPALGARDTAFCASRARNMTDPPLHRRAADGNYTILVTRGQGLRRSRRRIHRSRYWLISHKYILYNIF